MWQVNDQRSMLCVAGMLLLLAACQGDGEGTGATGHNGGGGAHPDAAGAGGGSTTSGSGGAGGSLFPDAGPPEGTFLCGSDRVCKLGVEYCQINVDGPCCGSSSLCAPLPPACTPTTECACFTAESCPMPEAFSSCEQTTDGGFTITCLGQ
jgi:hypothetical protein